MTPQQKKYAIIVGALVVAAGGYYYWRRKVSLEGDALLDYVKSLPSQVDLSKATEQGIKDVEDVKLRTDRVVVKDGGKILAGPVGNTKLKNLLASYAQRLHTAMAGAGTNTKEVFAVLDSIRTKNTLKWVDAMYKGVFKEGLFDAMKGEAALNNVQFGVFSDKTKYDLAIPGITESHWHPALASYFNSLPIY